MGVKSGAKFWRWDSVLRRLVVVAIVTDLLFAGLAAFGLWKSRQQYEDRAEVSTQNLARALSQHIEDVVDQIDLAVQSVADEVGEHLAKGDLTADHINAFIERQQTRLPTLIGLRVVSAAGENAYGIGIKPGVRTSVADRGYFHTLRDDPRAGLVISEPVIGRVSHKWSVILARRVNGPGETFGGVVYAAVTVDDFGTAFELIDVGKRGSIALRDAKLTLVARYQGATESEVAAAIGKQNGSPELVRQVAQMPQGGSYKSSRAFDNTERTYAFCRARRYPLYVIVGLASEEYLASWQNEAVATATLVGLFVAATAVLLWRTARNITARRKIEEELRLSARTDRLTGLPNRALFCDRLEMALQRKRRNRSYHFAVLFLDFDRFKTINDSLGHTAGDELLKEMARRMLLVVRSGDSLSRDARQDITGRLGGDEFVVLLDDMASTQDAMGVAERLMDAFSEPYELGSHKVYSTASIGIVTSDMEVASAEEVLRDADSAMYEAKSLGKGRYVVFDVSMRERVLQRMHLEQDLRKALESRELFLMYQPIVSLTTGHIESLEALLRWQHPKRGMISPAEFIPIAEDTGLILPIGEWVLRRACEQFEAWRRQLGALAPRSVSVNLSRNQLMMPDLPQTIRRVLDETGMNAACLHLEVTESAVMKDVAAATAVLREVRAIGVKLDMDDFGTGYSSLSCLHDFPFDVLKIDRSFIANIGRGREFAALVHAVIQLAANLQIKVVAEGIETSAQTLTLQALECDFGQGYLFGKPMPGEQVEAFLARPAAFAV